MRAAGCARAVALALVALLPAAAPAGQGTKAASILWPPPGYGAPKGSAWLVVRASAPPRTRLDGRPVGPPSRAEDGVYHIRLVGVRAQGSRVEVEAVGKRLALTLGGGEALFHARPPEACASCHDLGARGCGECHRWDGARHPPSRPGECARCHAGSRSTPRDVAPLCAGCHPKHAGARHPKLRHPISAPQDPARPGRPFDCASCHDPHAPVRLDALSAEERKLWCRGCHRQ